MEGLDQIIIGAVFEAFDLVLPARTRGQNQDREFLAGIAQTADHIHAGEFRQAEVHHRQIKRDFTAMEQGFFAVTGGIDRETLTLEACCQCFPQRCFVFHKQDAHDSSFPGWF